MKQLSFAYIQKFGIMLTNGDHYSDDGELMIVGAHNNSPALLNKPDSKADAELFVVDFVYRSSQDSDQSSAIKIADTPILIKWPNGTVDLQKHKDVDWSVGFEWKPYIPSLLTFDKSKLVDTEELFFLGVQVGGFATISGLEEDNALIRFEGEKVEVISIANDGKRDVVTFKHPVKGVGALVSTCFTGEMPSERAERQFRERRDYWLWTLNNSPQPVITRRVIKRTQLDIEECEILALMYEAMGEDRLL